MRESRVDFLVLPARNHQAVAPAWLDAGFAQCGDPDHAVAVDEPVRRLGGGAPGGAEEAVEAQLQRAAGNRPAEVDLGLLVCRRGWAGPWQLMVQQREALALLDSPAQTQVPLADAGRVVAVLAQQGCHGRPLRLDERQLVVVEHLLLQRAAPAIAAGEQAVAGRRADRGRRVHVGEAHTMAGQTIHVRGGNPGVAVVAARIPVTHVVGEEANDVRQAGHGGSMIEHIGNSQHGDTSRAPRARPVTAMCQGVCDGRQRCTGNSVTYRRLLVATALAFSRILAK